MSGRCSDRTSPPSTTTPRAIGRRYRRQDEIGTPCCVTIDFETVEQDRAVTIRDRDSMQQERVPIDSLVSALQQRLNRF
jgi:glycyl-tRNA synthetase